MRIEMRIVTWRRRRMKRASRCPFPPPISNIKYQISTRQSSHIKYQISTRQCKTVIASDLTNFPHCHINSWWKTCSLAISSLRAFLLPSDTLSSFTALISKQRFLLATTIKQFTVTWNMSNNSHLIDLDPCCSQFHQVSALDGFDFCPSRILILEVLVSRFCSR